MNERTEMHDRRCNITVNAIGYRGHGALYGH